MFTVTRLSVLRDKGATSARGACFGAEQKGSRCRKKRCTWQELVEAHGKKTTQSQLKTYNIIQPHTGLEKPGRIICKLYMAIHSIHQALRLFLRFRPQRTCEACEVRRDTGGGDLDGLGGTEGRTPNALDLLD